MKALSRSQATRCEHSTTDRCRCRCHGQFHGANRDVGGSAMATTPLTELGESDPHKVTEKRRPARPIVPLTGVQLALPGMPAPAPEDVLW
jgi:hypothetical protein